MRKSQSQQAVVEARQLSLQGIDASERQDWKAAENLFSQALAKNPADERAHQHFAEVMWQRGQHDAAVRHMQEAVRLSGGDPTLLVQMGEYYLQRGDIKAARDYANRAIESSRQLPSAWSLLADTHYRMGELDEAMEHYHRSLSLESCNPHAQIVLAEIHMARNRPRRALATLESLAAQYSPEETPQAVLHQQGLAYKSLGRYSDAAERLTMAVKAGDASPELMYQLSEAHYLAGNTASAKLALQSTLERTPYHTAALQLQEKIQQQDNRLTAGIIR